MVMGRLAIDARMQGQRPGAGLLKDALLRTLSVSKEAGIRALLVHAISEEVRNFYPGYGLRVTGYGFQVSPVDRMTLMLPVRHIKPFYEPGKLRRFV